MGGNQNTILAIALSSIIVVVDVKKAEKKQGAQSAPTQSSSYADPNKIFVGGFSDKITKDDLSGYFEKFDVVVCYDKLTRKARGFEFVTFESKEAGQGFGEPVSLLKGNKNGNNQG